MTEVSQAREWLINALWQYFEADSEAEVELAVLALHKGLEEALRAYLARLGYDEIDYRQLSFPELVDMIRDHTDLFGGDPKLPPLLVSLNTTRAKIAHPGEDKPTPKEIAQDAGQFADLIRRFWPQLFGETYPTPLFKPPKPKQDRPVIPEPPVEPRPAMPEAQRLPSSKLGQFLKRLWKDETEPRFQKGLFLKRAITIVIFFALAKWCKDGAIYTARWPEPVKYVGVALFLLAVGLSVWGVLTVWKVLRQLRLRGLLIILGIGYVVIVGASVLTSDNPLPFQQEVWLATRQLVTSSTRRARDISQVLIRTSGEFRFAYTGQRRPVKLAGMDLKDSSYLTPIPANQPAKLSLGAQPTVTPSRAPSVSEKETPAPSPAPTKYARGITASPSPAFTFVPTPTETQEHPTIPPLRSPDCPHPQARLTAPQVNQVITDEAQVEGTANIEHFDYYKFEFRREDGDIEDEWHWVESFKTPVEEGVLGIWHVSHLPAGIYTFRLTVVNREGNYPFPPCEVKVQITH
jgi:hypothetical protein